MSDLDVIDLPEHKYMIMEDCLYYYLREQSMAEGGLSGLQGAMPKLTGDSLSINISSIGLRNIHMNEMMKTAAIYGYAAIVRLSFNISLKIKSQKHLKCYVSSVVKRAKISRILPR